MIFLLVALLKNLAACFRRSITVSFIIGSLTASVFGDQVVLYDNFSDPLQSESTWFPDALTPGDYSIIPGQGYVLTPTSESLILGDNPGQRHMLVESIGLSETIDEALSVRALIRKQFVESQSHGNVAISAASNKIWAAVNPAGRLRLHYDGLTHLVENGTDINIAEEDAIVQLDIVPKESSGLAEFEFRIWRPKETMPVTPQHSGVGFADAIGSLGFWVNAGRVGSEDEFSPTVFRSYEAVQRTIAGDFNGDAIIDAHDIDSLFQAINSGVPRLLFDSNHDGPVTFDDAKYWITELKNTYSGDANLDGEFNSGDLVTVFQAAKFELDVDAGWAEGDWTGDRRFDSADFVKAFQDGGFEQGTRTTVATVPEPSNWLTIALGLISIRYFRKESEAMVAGRG
ncbi:MAG: hypothetical protein KDB27_26585 [Planctomycetales bacterium]|nr:hypothetical protein [Planctomycetales bacterium]